MAMSQSGQQRGAKTGWAIRDAVIGRPVPERWDNFDHACQTIENS